MTSSAFMNFPKDFIAKCSTPINSMPSKKENEGLASTSVIKSHLERQKTNFDKGLPNLEL